MASIGKLGNAVGGKSARPCDNCLKKRARYYCDADDAFLCQSCDTSVHSANPLARRHQRHRIGKNAGIDAPTPSWHQGFKRKARSPRGKKNGKQPRVDVPVDRNPIRMVPEICNEEINEENLLFRVPILDHDDVKINFQDFGPSETDILEFAADMECLIGNRSCFDFGELGIFDFDEKHKPDDYTGEAVPAIANEDHQIQIKKETLFLNTTVDETPGSITFLKLDINGVMSAWDSKKSPFLTVEKPKLKSIDFWTDFFGTDGDSQEIGEGIPVHSAAADGGREARVSRYREKRRTRLFAKKIRYEVRKLNAEKRPRMKGRFVKRSSFESPGNYSIVQKS